MADDMNLRVLVVDDEPAIRRFLRVSLGAHGCTVFEAVNGQEALWEGQERHFGSETVEVLDLLHVTPRLWQAAHVFHKEGSHEAAGFVRARLLRVLRGEVKGVVTGLRRQGTLAKLPAAKAKQLRKVCRYLKANEGRMRRGAGRCLARTSCRFPRTALSAWRWNITRSYRWRN